MRVASTAFLAYSQDRPAGSNGAETYAKPLDRAQRGPGISRHAGTGSSTGGSATSRGRAPTVAAVIGAPRGADAFTPAVSGIRAGSARAVPARSRPCWRSHGGEREPEVGAGEQSGRS